MEIISSPWFIGIGGGILSGLVVTSITRYLFSRKDNREYTQKVVTANQEIIYAVRPGISEGTIPTEDVLDSLISATALKYSVDANDLHNATAFADVLIKEVMDSSFLAASTKADFCQKLAQLSPTPKSEPSTVEVARSSSGLSDYRKRMVTIVSLMMGVMTGFMTVFFAIISSVFNKQNAGEFSKNFTILIPTLTMITMAFVATYSMWLFRFFERKRKDRQNPSSDLHEDS